MSNRYWLRYKELIVGDKKWVQSHRGGLEIEFNVKKSSNDDKENGNINMSEVSIYNLSQDSINSIEKDSIVILNAGYEGNVGNILNGNVMEVNTIRDGLENITTMIIADGGKEWRDAKYSQTYAAGTKASYIMRELANIMGYEVGIIEPASDIEYKLGKTISGKCNTTLKQLVKDTNSKLYIDNNRLFIMEKDKGVENGFLISADTGLLEAPTMNEEGEGEEKTITYNISSKFNHELTVNGLIKVESSTINGNYRIIEVEHTDEFETNLKVVNA